jgi:hypothetical protein
MPPVNLDFGLWTVNDGRKALGRSSPEERAGIIAPISWDETGKGGKDGNLNHEIGTVAENGSERLLPTRSIINAPVDRSVLLLSTAPAPITAWI